MSTAAASPTASHAPTGRAVAFLPPERMARYQWAKVIGGAFFVAIFSGWLFIQWSNALMRTIAAALVLLTVWQTLRSVVADAMRTRGRLIELTWEPGGERDDAVLRITTPERVSLIPVRDIASARWSDDDDHTFGLVLLDRNGGQLAHLDAWFVDHQEEARTLLHWARQHTRFEFPVHWPQTV